jgi:hypothetical protein
MALKSWYHPKLNTNARNDQPTGMSSQKLVTAQRQGALAITGGFRTSPTDALDAYAALLPMHHRLEVVKHNKAVRIASLPPVHPLHKQIRTAARRRTRRHRMPLHKLAKSLGCNPDDIETILVVQTNPAHKHNNPIQVSIPADKEASVRENTYVREEIKVYSDSLIHDSKVGAAAVLFRSGKL